MSTNPPGTAREDAEDALAITPRNERQDTAGDPARGEVMEVAINQDTYGLRMIDTHEGRNSASLLINKMYAWRGYAGTHRLDDNPNRITLTASEKDGQPVGTLSLGIDSPIGLLADEVFKDEIDAFRDRGARVCELTKLAFDPRVQSKEALASLFHLALLYGRDLHHCTDVFIEVNPRHRRFYESMLGFKRHGEVRTNPRVNAPAYLLSVSLDYVTEQVNKYGGTGAENREVRSFYPLFFSPREERGIIERLLVIH